MKNIKLIYLLLTGLILSFTACDRDINDWEQNGEYSGLFRPLSFAQSQLKATSIEIKYNTIVNATKYVFEFSEDTLEFQNSVRTIEILADTLTVYSKNDNVLKSEYRTMFEDLNGSTFYSVRMKGVNERNGLESEYMSFTFTTPGEQLFTSSEVGINDIALFWTPVPNVTHLSISVYNRETLVYDFLKDVQLNSTEIANGSAILSDLTGGTGYRITINNDDIIRGTLTLKTLGMSGGETLVVNPGDDIAALLAGSISRGIGDVTLLFSENTTYDLGSVKIPFGIDNLIFTSTGSRKNADLPKLTLPSVGFDGGPIISIGFENVYIDGGGTATYLFNIGDLNGFTSVNFEGCEIKHFSRSIVRISDGQQREIESVKFNNCLIQDIGTNGYGVINLGTNFRKFDIISFTNCTLFELGTQLYGGNTVIGEVIMNNCTFFNSTAKMDQVFRFDTAPAAVTISNCIFSGPNNGGAINSGRADYSSYLEFSDNCYITSDLQVYKYNFAGITSYTKSSDELFVSPATGDFHFKDQTFAGKDTAGDPFWY